MKWTKLPGGLWRSPIYHDHNALMVLLYLQDKVSAENRRTADGRILRPGQVTYTRGELTEATGLSEKAVRTALGKLTEQGFLVRETCRRYTVGTLPQTASLYKTPVTTPKKTTTPKVINKEELTWEMTTF